MSHLSVPVDDSSPEFHNALSRLAKDGLKSSGASTVVHDWDSILPQLEASCVDLDQLTDTGSVYTPEESSPLNNIHCTGITQNANYEGQIFGINTCDNLHSARPTSQTRFIESEGIRTPWTDCTSPDPTDFITTDRTRQKLVRSSATQRGNTVYYSEHPNKFRGSVRRTSHIHGSPSFQEKLIPPRPLTDFPESRNTSHSLEDDLWTVGSELGIFVGGVKGQGSDGATAVLPQTAHNTDYACYPNEYRSEIPIKQKYSIQSEGSFDFHGCTSQHTRRLFPKSALERLTPPRQCTPIGKNNNLSSAESVPLQRPVSAKLKAVRWALKSPDQHKRQFETGVTSSPQSKRERNAHVKETEDCWCIVYPQEEPVNRETFWPVHQGAKLGPDNYGEFLNASRPVAKPLDLHFSLKDPIPIKNISQEAKQQKDNLVRPASLIKRARQKTTTKERRLNAQINRQQTETLIEAIEALRDSISLSNRQLELHLKEAQPLEVSKVQHRMHGSVSEIMPHRASSNSNRTSRTRGFKHDFSKRTGAFRRSEECSQTRDEKVRLILYYLQ
ncbi:hypothetical protein EG68_01797 [Paragonimus skrjabini miyazakii]|uniref:Uncharacterized protein n=1 Tax=Paragonimus skrjabini miyazakii TaxID=59628 RepID=A0A8S9Z0R6_9TREM|nr:hypothetical protein EG68_01797 [Paragonimus skrjabini miyazakii]